MSNNSSANVSTFERAKEFFVSVAVFLLAIIFASQEIGWSSEKGSFYQAEFGPAVSLACSGEFKAYQNQGSKIKDFLTGQARGLDCEYLADKKKSEPNGFQKSHLYLMGLVGALWAVFGLDWANVLPLHMLLYGGSVLSAFLLFRLVLPRWLSLALTCVFSLSALHLNYLPHLRDYSKAPFILFVLFLIGVLVKQERIDKYTYQVAVLSGVVIGLGLGFRMDVVLLAPLVILAILIGPSVKPSTYQLKVRGTAILLFLVSIGLSAIPILHALSGGSNIYHFALLGLTDAFNSALGVQSSQHDLGSLYNDLFVFEAIASYDTALGNARSGLYLHGENYDRVARQYYLELITAFPGDVIARYLAAVVKMFSLLAESQLRPTGFPLLGSIVNLTAAGLPYLTIGALGLLIVKNVKLGLFLLISFFYVVGYPSLQFDPRHYFHLQPVLLLLVAAISLWAWRGCVSILKTTSRPTVLNPGHSFVRLICRSTFVTLSIFSLLAGSLFFARYVQQNSIGRLQSILVDDNLEKIEFEQIRWDNENRILLRPIIAEAESTGIDFSYWALEYNSAECGKSQVMLKLQYTAKESYADFSRDVTITSHGKGRYIFPTFSGGAHPDKPVYAERHFDGILIDDVYRDCILGMMRIKKTGAWPITVSVNLSEASSSWIYQKIDDFESVQSEEGVISSVIALAEPPALNVDWRMLMQNSFALSSMDRQSMSYVSPSVEWEKGSAIVKADVESRYSYLIQGEKRAWSSKSYLVVSGIVGKGGGLTVGALKDNMWNSQLNIKSAGQFWVVIELKPGEYVPTIANNIEHGSRNNVLIKTYDWFSDGERIRLIGEK